MLSSITLSGPPLGIGPREQQPAGHGPGDFTRPERAPCRLSAQNDTCPQQPPCYRRPDLPETSGTGPDDPDRPGDDRAAALPSARGRWYWAEGHETGPGMLIRVSPGPSLATMPAILVIIIDT